MASFPAMTANLWWQERGSRLHAHCFVKASTSELPSLSVLMKSAGPVRLLMGHTSWKDSANSSFCKKRKKWAFSWTVCQVTIQWTAHELCSECWTATLMRDIPSERGSEGTGVPLLSGKGISTGDYELFSYILNYGKIFFYRLSFYGNLFALIFFLWKFVVDVPSCFSDWLSLSNLTVLSSNCFLSLSFVAHWSFPHPPKLYISLSEFPIQHTTFWNNLDYCVLNSILSYY